MTNEILNINFQNITVKKGVIEFNEYEPLKQQALQLAAEIERVEVTDENVKNSKKLLAAVNKRLKEMDDKRIAIKKDMLEPYNEFEQQVKEILSIVKNADSIVREQVKQLEENERDEKRRVIAALFDKRIKQYAFGDVFTFENFLKPNHLNKTTSLNVVESDMVQWLEKIDADLQAINSLPNSDAILVEYYDTKDVATAIRIVSEREKLKQQLKQVTEPKKPVSHVYNISLFNDSDVMVVEMFLQLKDIKYDIEKVEI